MLLTTHHTKNQENHNLNGKRQLVDANTEMDLDKDFKAVILNLQLDCQLEIP